MDLLLAFLLRLACGLAAGMGIIPLGQVTSGYYRNNLYVLLGCNVLAGLAAWRLQSSAAAWCAVGGGLSYLGAVCWLYERHRAGRLALWLVAAVALAGAWAVQRPWLAASGARGGTFHTPAGGRTLVHDDPQTPPRAGATSLGSVLRWCDAPLSATLAGGSVAAMLLGHWYLNAPGMQLAPLLRLLRWLLACAGTRAVCSAASTALAWQGGLSPAELGFLVLRWGAGLLGVMVLVVMAARSLAVPNTQSATGILYVAVIAAFAGELLALLLAGRYALAL